jgi:hypothetical protein
MGVSFVRRFPDTIITMSRQDRRHRQAYTDGTPILGTGTRAPLGRGVNDDATEN